MEKVLGISLQELAEALPDYAELRLMGHRLPRKPITLWSSRPPEEEEKPKPKDEPDPMFWASPKGTQKEYYRP